MVATSQIIKFKQLIEIKEKLNVQFLSHPSHILNAQEPLLATLWDSSWTQSQNLI